MSSELARLQVGVSEIATHANAAFISAQEESSDRVRVAVQLHDLIGELAEMRKSTQNAAADAFQDGQSRELEVAGLRDTIEKLKLAVEQTCEAADEMRNEACRAVMTEVEVRRMCVARQHELLRELEMLRDEAEALKEVMQTAERSAVLARTEMLGEAAGLREALSSAQLESAKGVQATAELLQIGAQKGRALELAKTDLVRERNVQVKPFYCSSYRALRQV
jgi:hypothetical protein